MNWEIYHDDQWRTFAGLGLSDLTRSILSQAPDTVEFAVEGGGFDEDLLWQYGDTVRIRRDGVQWFHGRVVRTPRQGSARNEKVGYRLAGPWFWLDNLVFQQTWNYADESGATLSGKSSHLFLGQKVITDPNGSGLPTTTSQTTKEQMIEILEWAIACGTPLQIGTILDGIEVPSREIRDTTCGEAIKQMLRWHPDAVAWFDYSTTPPTIHIGKRANLQPVTFTVGSPPLAECAINPRDDLRVPAVVLKFESTDTSQPDGIARQVLTRQVAPVGANEEVLGALVATIDLQGAAANWLRAVTTTQTIDAASSTLADKIAWWKSKLPWLNDSRIVSFTITDVARSGTHNYPRELVDGQITEWMVSQGVHQEDEDISAKIKVTYANATSKNNDVDEVQTVKIKSTDAALGEKQWLSLQSFTAGEAEPVGLAQSLYDALSELQYEGQVILHEEEINTAMRAAGVINSAGVGCVVNIDGARSEWATMRALIIGVTENAVSGETTLSFGPAGHLGYGDLIELLQVNRTRFNYTAPAARTDPASGARGELGLGKYLPRGQAASGGAVYTQFWTISGTKSIQQDTTDSTAKLEVKETTSSTKTVKLESTSTGALLHITDGTKVTTLDLADIPAGFGVVKIRQAEYCKNNIVYDCLLNMSQLKHKVTGALSDPV